MSTTTKVFTSGPKRYALSELPKVGEAIKNHPAYPPMHADHGNDYFSVLHSVCVDDGILHVIGDTDNGWYEWVWFLEPKAPAHCVTKTGRVHYTRSGWGMAGYCLRNGLNFAFNLQTQYGEDKPHQLI